jgi:hypothetical protein
MFLYKMSSLSIPFRAGQITLYGLQSATDCHGLMEPYMEQMTPSDRRVLFTFIFIKFNFINGIKSNMCIFKNKSGLSYSLY